MMLETFCRKFQALLERKPEEETIIEEGRLLVGELVSHEEWFIDFLGRLHEDRSLFSEQKPSLWPNEITLHRSPDQSLLVLAYIWEPRAVDIIHDHGTWGIIGAFFNSIREIKYRRLDNGCVEGYAHIEEASSTTIQPRQTTFVLPLDQGIHRMENPSDGVAITVNVYGRTIRKGYINFFYPETRSLSRAYPPRTHKEVLLIRTLGYIGKTWAADILSSTIRRPLPDYLREECELSLAKLNGSLKPGGCTLPER